MYLYNFIFIHRSFKRSDFVVVTFFCVLFRLILIFFVLCPLCHTYRRMCSTTATTKTSRNKKNKLYKIVFPIGMHSVSHWTHNVYTTYCLQKWNVLFRLVDFQCSLDAVHCFDNWFGHFAFYFYHQEKFPSDLPISSLRFW